MHLDHVLGILRMFVRAHVRGCTRARAKRTAITDCSDHILFGDHVLCGVIADVIADRDRKIVGDERREQRRAPRGYRPAGA
jgi:hypothetical protein